MGGQTNIRKAEELLIRVGQEGYNDVARIPNTESLLFIDARSCTESELERHVDLFEVLKASQDRWIRFKSKLGDGFTAPPGSVPVCGIPKTTITPALGRLQPSMFDKEEAPAHVEELLYLAVTQGKMGIAARKLQLADSRCEIASLMFHEAINGYSTVFVGVGLKSEIMRAQGYKTQWMKVESLERLCNLRDQNEGRLEDAPLSVGIIC